jgi:pimeloyl-ACP methyl ester carboxylesterase
VTTPDADTPNDLHRLVQGVAHQEMTGTSHWMQLAEPDDFNRVLDGFLDRIGGSS